MSTAETTDETKRSHELMKIGSRIAARTAKQYGTDTALAILATALRELLTIEVREGRQSIAMADMIARKIGEAVHAEIDPPVWRDLEEENEK